MKKIAWLLGFALASAPAAALANGRFPESNQIFFSPTDPDFVGMRVTFGLLLSHDKGSKWGWICEPSTGSIGQEDPMWTATPNKNLIATTFSGVTISRDQGCNFSFAPQFAPNTLFIDLAADPADQKRVVFFTSAYDKTLDGQILFKSQLYETLDEGTTINALGPAFDPLLFGYTVDLAKSDPMRVYTSFVQNYGQTTAEGFLLTSIDHGATYTSASIPFVNKEHGLYIAAVDPTNADRVYLRTLGAPDAPSRLVVSEDGGKTFATKFTSKGALAGFALSADGSKVFVGGVLDGIWEANISDFNFVQKNTVEVQCLATRNDELWACSSERGGFVAGVSKDEGKTFEAKLHFCDITLPLACPAGTGTGDKCVGDVAKQTAINLGCVDGGLPDGGVIGTPEGGTTPDAGNGGGGGGDGGCSCNLPGGSAPPLALIGLGLGVFALARRRR